MVSSTGLVDKKKSFILSNTSLGRQWTRDESNRRVDERSDTKAVRGDHFLAME